CDVGGYQLVAKRTDSWEAIVAILISLDAQHPDYFHQLMRRCRALSNSTPETDGLDDVLSVEHQVIYDLARGRDLRRNKQGYVMPAQARAFLQMSRRLQLGSDSMPSANPVTSAYFRSLEETAKIDTASQCSESKVQIPSADPLEGAGALVDVLLESGIIA